MWLLYSCLQLHVRYMWFLITRTRSIHLKYRMCLIYGSGEYILYQIYLLWKTMSDGVSLLILVFCLVSQIKAREPSNLVGWKCHRSVFSAIFYCGKALVLKWRHIYYWHFGDNRCLYKICHSLSIGTPRLDFTNCQRSVALAMYTNLTHCYVSFFWFSNFSSVFASLTNILSTAHWTSTKTR